MSDLGEGAAWLEALAGKLERAERIGACIPGDDVVRVDARAALEIASRLRLLAGALKCEDGKKPPDP